MAGSADEFALAVQYYTTGNLGLAEQYCVSILNEEPAHAEALHLLGLIARQKGGLDQAIVYLNKSLTANAANPITWQHAGDVLLDAGDVHGGITYYEQVLRLRPDFAEGYNTLGLAWQRLGEWTRAANCFRQAIRLAPSLAAPYNNLGSVLRTQGHTAEAAEAFKQAIALWPHNPDIAYNLGSTHHDQGELDQAIAYYRQALELAPSYAAEVSNSLATAYKEQGLLDEAVVQYQETLKLQPGHALATYNLSELAAVQRHVFPPEEITQIKARMVSGRYPPLERSLWAFALANVLSEQGAHDEAFHYYQEANELQRGLPKNRNLGFDARAHEAIVDRIIADYGRSYFERVKKWGTSSEVPVFIVGMPRSGSTLVEQIIASHPKAFGAGEIGNIYRFIAQVGGPGIAVDKNALPAPAQLLPNVRATRQLAAAYLARIAEHGQGAARVTIKNLENYLGLGIIATFLPGARVIHCRRDPVDVCLSCYFQNFKDMAFACSLEDIGVYYRCYEKLMAHWAEVLPLRVHEVRYEDLVHNQETISRDLISFCGLEWDERCLSFWNTPRVVQTASSVQVRRPISARAIGRSQHYRAHLGPLLKGLGQNPKS